MLAYCGIDCSECPAFKATANDDDDLRQQTAKDWSKMFNAEIKAEDINCKGCKSDGVKFSHCNDCKIRACAIEKHLENCGWCDDFACEDVNFVISNVPEAKAALISINKKR